MALQNGIVKTLVDSIRDWVKGYVSQHAGGADSRVDTLLAKVPTAASADNQLADKAYVNDKVGATTHNYRGYWKEWEDIPSDVVSYPEDFDGNTTPTKNDYIVLENASGYPNEVLEDGDVKIIFGGTFYKPNCTIIRKGYGDITNTYSTYTNSWISYGIISLHYESDNWHVKSNEICYYNGNVLEQELTSYRGESSTFIFRKDQSSLKGTWRFKYTGSWDTNGKGGWQPEYQVNEEPLTTDQVTAINSGITSALVAQIGKPVTPIKHVVAADVTEQVIQPNELYFIGSRDSDEEDAEIADIVISVPMTSGEPTNFVGEYHYIIEMGDSLYGVTHPTDVISKWQDGEAPTLETGKTYEFSILNGIALYVKL